MILDISIVIFYFITILVVAYLKSHDEKDTKEFVVGNRQIPWFAVLCSIVATEISAATFIGLPAVGYQENMNYLQFFIGSFLARFAIGFIFITAYYKFDALTVYDYLKKRFGEQTRVTATLFFLVTRILASGVRLMIAATGLAVLVDIPTEWMIILFTLITILYTSFGGIKAVIWTDMVQAFVFIGGGIVALSFLVHLMPDGWSSIFQIAQEHNKFEIFRFEPTAGKGFFSDPNLLWLAIINGFITTFAALGVDQDLTQRMLTCSTAKESRRSVILSGFASFPITITFMLIGTALFAYFKLNPGHDLPSMIVNGKAVIAYDKIFPYFIREVVPSGFKGFLAVGLIAAAMSSLDSTMAALSSSAVVDIYRPLFRPDRDEKHYLNMSRIFVIVFGIFLALTAIMLKDSRGMLWLCFKIGSITYGSLLGIFLVAALSKRGNNLFNLIGMISAAMTTSTLLICIEKGCINLSWSWLILIGASMTIVIALFGNPIDKKREA